MEILQKKMICRGEAESVPDFWDDANVAKTVLYQQKYLVLQYMRGGMEGQIDRKERRIFCETRSAFPSS